MIREQHLNPSAEDLAAFLTTHGAHRPCLVQVAAQAEISYVGRAVSLAEAGQYLLILKADGSLQIHGPRGVKPVNWQPKSDRITATLRDGLCVLTVARRNPEETVTVTFLEVHLALALALSEEGDFLLAGSEAQMQARLARHPEVIEEGLTVLERELLVGVGGVDLYARDALGRFVVVELKRGKATQDAVHQLQRYVEAVRTQVLGEVRGVLAAPGITAPALRALEAAGLEFTEVQALPMDEEESAQPSLF